MTTEEAQAGLDSLKAQCALLRTQLAQLEELLATMTAERAVAMVNEQLTRRAEAGRE